MGQKVDIYKILLNMNGGTEYKFKFITSQLCHFFPQNDSYCIGFT